MLTVVDQSVCCKSSPGLGPTGSWLINCLDLFKNSWALDISASKSVINQTYVNFQ